MELQAEEAGGGGYTGGGTISSEGPGYGGGSYYIGENGTAIAGDQQFLSPTGTNETGHSGDGYARITIVE